MRQLRPVVTALALILATVAHAGSSQYLCIVDQSAGLRYDDLTKAWRPQAFAAGSKYVLRRLKDDDLTGKYASLLDQQPELNWGMFKFGENVPIGACNETIGLLFCKGLGGVTSDFKVDIESHRFTIAYINGYVNQAFSERALRTPPEKYKHLTAHGEKHDPAPDDLFVQIGKCSPF